MWIFYAVLAAFFQSATRAANQLFKHDGINLTLVIKALLSLYMLPFVFFVSWPTDPRFYLFTLITAPFVVYQDKSFFNFTSHFGAGPVTRIEPLSVPFVFVSWLLLHPALLSQQLDKPLLFAGLCLCIALSTFFALRMRSCAVNGAALRAMVPLVFVVGTINLLSKASTDYMPKDSGIVVYVFIQSLLVVALSLIGASRKSDFKQAIMNKRMLSVSFGLSLLTLCVMVLRLWAFKETANPAYVTAIMLTGPFWTLLLNRILKHKETASIRDGLGIVVSVLALTVLSCL